MSLDTEINNWSRTIRTDDSMVITNPQIDDWVSNPFNNVEPSFSSDRVVSALGHQVGGEHYQMEIQPIEFIMKNNLDFCQGNMVKYAVRFKNKNGVEDLKKVMHYAQLAAKLEYGVDI